MSKIDDILGESAGEWCGCMEGDMSDEFPGKKKEVKQEIIDLMLEIIGPDEEPGRTMGPGMPSFQRNQLRRELRTKVKGLL